MSRRTLAGGLSVTVLVVVGVIAAEQQTPGITLLTVAVLAEVAQRIAAAAVWPLALIGAAWLGSRWGRIGGRREQMADFMRAQERHEDDADVIRARFGGRP